MASLATQEAIAYLRTPAAIRDRCQRLFDLCCQDRLEHFTCDLAQLERTADFVLATMREQYPDFKIPFHSRWRHFDVGGVPRRMQLDKALSGMSATEKAKAQIDLVVTSVLLDAGAGSEWRYVESSTEQVFARSEGLAVASFHLFCQGAFSINPGNPWQADAQGLQRLSEDQLRAGFQVSQSNPLVGVAGRTELLQKLGRAIAQQPQRFGDPARPGNLIDWLQDKYSNPLEAADLLGEVLEGFAAIWPGRVEIAGVNLGDVWSHLALAGNEPTANIVPFHKLSQWLTYSLIEPLAEAGLQVVNLDSLTGLAEYRNGGLCVDLGLLQPKHPGVLGQAHLPGSEVIVEWRALTVILLDQIAQQIRQKLELSALELPLVKVLEGGTWSAGRRIAKQLRPGGTPPILLESDGTVF